MDMTADVLSVLSLIAAFCALVVSIWSARKSSAIGDEQNRLQGELLRIETDRERDRNAAASDADLSARVERRHRGGALRVTNRGPAPAHDLQVMIDGRPLAEHPLFGPWADRSGSILAAGATVDFTMLVVDGMPTNARVALHWRDVSGRSRRWESDLSLGG